MTLTKFKENLSFLEALHRRVTYLGSGLDHQSKQVWVLNKEQASSVEPHPTFQYRYVAISSY